MTAFLLVVLGAAGSAGAQTDECFSRAGRPIPRVESDSLPYAAWARLRENGDPVIYWNSGRVSAASRSIRLLVYLHECAHHILGHVGKRPTLAQRRVFEIEADCWAMQRMVEEEMITMLTLDDTLEEIRRWTGDSTHLGGELLALSVRRCLYDKTNQDLWFRFLEVLVIESPDSLAGIRGDLIPESGDERIRESDLNPPGTFDCDLRGGHVLLCMLFKGGRHDRVVRRYQQIKEILQRWGRDQWRFLEREQPTFHQPVVLLGWNDRTGVNLSLVVTDTNRLFFTWSALPP